MSSDNSKELMNELGSCAAELESNSDDGLYVVAYDCCAGADAGAACAVA